MCWLGFKLQCQYVYFQITVRLKDVLEKAVMKGAFSKQNLADSSPSDRASTDFNNRQARQLVASLASVPCAFSCYGQQPCIYKQKITEINLDEHNR